MIWDELAEDYGNRPITRWLLASALLWISVSALAIQLAPMLAYSLALVGLANSAVLFLWVHRRDDSWNNLALAFVASFATITVGYFAAARLPGTPLVLQEGGALSFGDVCMLVFEHALDVALLGIPSAFQVSLCEIRYSGVLVPFLFSLARILLIEHLLFTAWTGAKSIMASSLITRFIRKSRSGEGLHEPSNESLIGLVPSEALPLLRVTLERDDESSTAVASLYAKVPTDQAIDELLVVGSVHSGRKTRMAILHALATLTDQDDDAVMRRASDIRPLIRLYIESLPDQNLECFHLLMEFVWLFDMDSEKPVLARLYLETLSRLAGTLNSEEVPRWIGHMDLVDHIEPLRAIATYDILVHLGIFHEKLAERILDFLCKFLPSNRSRIENPGQVAQDRNALEALVRSLETCIVSGKDVSPVLSDLAICILLKPDVQPIFKLAGHEYSGLLERLRGMPRVSIEELLANHEHYDLSVRLDMIRISSQHISDRELCLLGDAVLTEATTAIRSSEWFSLVLAHEQNLSAELQSILRRYARKAPIEESPRILAVLLAHSEVNVAKQEELALDFAKLIDSAFVLLEQDYASGSSRKRMAAAVRAHMRRPEHRPGVDWSDRWDEIALDLLFIPLNWIDQVGTWAASYVPGLVERHLAGSDSDPARDLPRRARQTIQRFVEATEPHSFGQKVCRYYLRAKSKPLRDSGDLIIGKWPALLDEIGAMHLIKKDDPAAIAIASEWYARMAQKKDVPVIRDSARRILRFLGKTKEEVRRGFDDGPLNRLLETILRLDYPAWIALMEEAVWPYKSGYVFRGLAVEVVRVEAARRSDRLERWVLEGIVRQKHFGYEVVLRTAAELRISDMVRLILNNPREEYVYSTEIFAQAIRATDMAAETKSLLQSPLYAQPHFKPFAEKLAALI